MNSSLLNGSPVAAPVAPVAPVAPAVVVAELVVVSSSSSPHPAAISPAASASASSAVLLLSIRFLSLLSSGGRRLTLSAYLEAVLLGELVGLGERVVAALGQRARVRLGLIDGVLRGIEDRGNLVLIALRRSECAKAVDLLLDVRD